MILLHPQFSVKKQEAGGRVQAQVGRLRNCKAVGAGRVCIHGRKLRCGAGWAEPLTGLLLLTQVGLIHTLRVHHIHLAKTKTLQQSRVRRMDLQHSNLEYIYLEPHLDIHVPFK